ncbi:hypothetical protein NHQ30_002572 [Ciborinia camelliae]|nr:hypothetical protein NHQ30_002572 [Ciborinia camelliae]
MQPPPIFIPGVPDLPQVKTYEMAHSIDERIAPEIIRMPSQAPGVTPVTAIRSHCPPTVLSNNTTKPDTQSISISSDPPLRQNERQDSRVANWVRNTSSNSSYLGHQAQKTSKVNSVLPARFHDSANDPAILALMTAVEEARTSSRLIGSSEYVAYAHSSPSTSHRDRKPPANGRPKGYPYLKSDLHRDTGRLDIYQSDLPLAHSQS